MDYPRLLLVTPNAFNPLSGGGVTFTNLFHGWPREKIATAHHDHVQPSTEVCGKYYFLSKEEFPWQFPFSLANLAGDQDEMEKTLKKAVSGEKAGAKTKFFEFTQKIARFFFGDEIPTRAVLSDDLRKWIADFKPQVIYTILGNLQYIRLVKKIAREFRIPVVIHMMDDWPAVMYGKGIFGPFRRRSMKIELQQMMNNAAACLGICDSMAEAYEKRYGRPFGSFHNTLDAKDWLEKARKNWASSPPFTILYGGALMRDSQLESVRDAADAVAELHADGMDIKFNIYAPWYFAALHREQLQCDGCVQVLDMPETMDVEDLFVSADLLLLPVNFDEATVKYVKYSMPTKVPAYMFSGTPTLAYGPDCVASIDYAKQWAYCVTQKNKNKLCDAIKKLASDETLRRDFGMRAQKLAATRHDRARVAENFHKVLIEAAKSGRM